jgi:hypothetical protein
MITITCLDCKQPITLNFTPEVGQLIKCSNCSREFEVTWLFPLRIDYQEIDGQISATQKRDLE